AKISLFFGDAVRFMLEKGPHLDWSPLANHLTPQLLDSYYTSLSHNDICPVLRPLIDFHPKRIVKWLQLEDVWNNNQKVKCILDLLEECSGIRVVFPLINDTACQVTLFAAGSFNVKQAIMKVVLARPGAIQTLTNWVWCACHTEVQGVEPFVR